MRLPADAAGDAIFTTVPGETVSLSKALFHETRVLDVTCEPAGVRMTVAGQSYALPVQNLYLPTASYTLHFEKENCFSRDREVTLAQAATRAPTVPLAAGETGLTWRRDPGVCYGPAQK
ncbi:MAG: hypothetical protein HYZ53_00095 [Planctomycetes bacterium]|nr:hypothetical protein [Planctomycetota bacterium]